MWQKFLIVVAILSVTHYIAYRLGGESEAHDNQTAAVKQSIKASNALDVFNIAAAATKSKTEQKYTVIEKEVVKYVKNTNRTVCRFDDQRVQLKQNAVDAANAISRTNAGTLQATESQR